MKLITTFPSIRCAPETRQCRGRDGGAPWERWSRGNGHHQAGVAGVIGRWHSVTRKKAAMTRVFIDSAMSIDGFWADREGQSVFPLGDMHGSGLIKALVDRTGAV